MVTLDGRHPGGSVEMLSVEDGVGSLARLLRLYYAFSHDSKAILPAQTIKHGKILKIFSAIVPREVVPTNTTPSLLSYQRAYEKKYGMLFVDERLMNIMDNKTYSNFLVTNSKATYVPYIKVSK